MEIKPHTQSKVLNWIKTKSSWKNVPVNSEITTYNNLWAAVKILLKWIFVAPSADGIVENAHTSKQVISS